MKIRPWHDCILATRVAGAGGRPEGIIIPNTAKEKLQEGKVVA